MKAIIDVKSSSWIKFALYSFLLIGIYYSALSWLILKDWEREAYSYCWLIPPAVLYLLWIKRNDLKNTPSNPSWKGLIVVVAGISFYWLGELSGEFFSLYLSLWLLIVGICWIHLGWEKLKTVGFAIIFMLTMFPLPHFFIAKLMLQLQLISSKLGALLIQLIGMPVARYGNIIDLGFTQLQIVEACSGLNSLISLVVLCLLLVHFFKDHIWKRAVLLISSVPLAILTNSIRIALTAVLHKYFGHEIAQGFFHGFSGLVIFLISIPVLLLVIKVLTKLPPHKNKLLSSSTSTRPQPSDNKVLEDEKSTSKSAVLRQPIYIVTMVLLVSTFALSQNVEFRQRVPAKKSFDQFPLQFAKWSAEGRQSMSKWAIDELDLNDYMIADYQSQKNDRVNTYVVYYERQTKGKSIHSPASCLPGSGWSFDQSGTVRISGLSGNPGSMEVNRAVLQYGSSTQIAYYWFAQRGRILNNAYQLKIYNFWDALTMQRTDGALIRLITPVYEAESLAAADARLQNFVRDFVPVLEEYIPGKKLHTSS